MVLFRALAAVSLVAFASVAAVGCSSGLSTEDAKVRCDQDKQALSAQFNDSVYAQCQACYEECGDDCVRTASSPVSYACVDGSTSGTGGTATTTTTTATSSK